MKNLTEQPAWHALCQHYDEIATHHMRDLFSSDSDRSTRFSIQCGGILLDYSRNRITANTLHLLHELAISMDLQNQIHALFAGEAVNTTEHRPALHTALRKIGPNSVPRDDISKSRERLYHFVNDIHSAKRTGVTNKPFKHIVNIGIGGSYLGPKMCTEALKDFAVAPLTFHFMSTVDPDHVRDILADLDPETTLIIVSSKSFTTIETLTNARTVLTWLTEKIGVDAVQKQTVAITANINKARDFGIAEMNIFTFEDWVGGRYSIWSAIGLPLVLMIGTQQFEEFLHGAHMMDSHFLEAPLDQNIPVTLALLGIWYNNFFHADAQAIIPYSYRLRTFVSYIQQLEMESNGKSVAQNGERVPYMTCPIIFGEEGCNSQHTFFQLLHQGRHLIPIDFILVAKPHAQSPTSHHDIVTASALSQSYALTRGKTAHEAVLEHAHPDTTESQLLAKHRAIDGNKPNNLIILDELTPANLGALIAAYEHKIFVQSVLWNINPFDQWGVELGKQNLPLILQQMTHTDTEPFADEATHHLIKHFRRVKHRI